MGQVVNDKVLFKSKAALMLALNYAKFQPFCCFSSVAWQLTLNPLEKQKETGVNEGHSVYRSGHEGDLCILIFRSLLSSDKAVGLDFLQFLTIL